MARFIKNYCPRCGHETTHKVWKEDWMENTGATRLLWGCFDLWCKYDGFSNLLQVL